jgi:hypothetical protein
MRQEMLSRAPDVMEARVSEDELVLLGPESEDYVGLNAVAADVWTRLARPTRFDALVAALAEDYDAPPETIADDLEPVIRTLSEAGLLRRGEGG